MGDGGWARGMRVRMRTKVPAAVYHRLKTGVGLAGRAGRRYEIWDDSQIPLVLLHRRLHRLRQTSASVESIEQGTRSLQSARSDPKEPGLN